MDQLDDGDTVDESLFSGNVSVTHEPYLQLDLVRIGVVMIGRYELPREHPARWESFSGWYRPCEERDGDDVERWTHACSVQHPFRYSVAVEVGDLGSSARDRDIASNPGQCGVFLQPFVADCRQPAATPQGAEKSDHELGRGGTVPFARVTDEEMDRYKDCRASEA